MARVVYIFTRVYKKLKGLRLLNFQLPFSFSRCIIQLDHQHCIFFYHFPLPCSDLSATFPFLHNRTLGCYVFMVTAATTKVWCCPQLFTKSLAGKNVAFAPLKRCSACWPFGVSPRLRVWDDSRNSYDIQSCDAMLFREPGFCHLQVFWW